MTDIISSVYAVQKSVDEVFSYFKNPNRTVTRDTKFDIFDDMPMLISNASTDKDWANTLLDNPAPLWIPTQNEMSKTQNWKYRGQPDNHSAFALKDGRPGFEKEVATNWSARPECTEIYAASFRGDDQFPFTQAINANAGLLQISETGNTWLDPSKSDEKYFATYWAPVRFPDVTYASIPTSITVRDKKLLSDLQSADGANLPVVHCLSFFDGIKTITISVRQPRSDMNNAGKLTATAIAFTDPNQGKADQFKFTPGTKQGAIAASTIWSNKLVFEGFDTLSSIDMMNLRCLILAKTTRGPTLASVVCDQKSIYASYIHLKDGSSTSMSPTVKPWTTKTTAQEPDWPAQPYIKQYRANDQISIVFCQHSAVANNSYNVRAAALSLVTDEISKHGDSFTEQYFSTSVAIGNTNSPFNQLKSSCFLVSHLRNLVCCVY